MVKGLLVAGLRSGDGKTLITIGLLRYLFQRSFNVQPFKVGPDYIDPKWHTLSAKVSSYNLDLFSMGRTRLSGLFYDKSIGKDFAIVEGAMGLFDGKYSAFEVAKILNLPVLLVLDTFGVAESISYVVKGISQVLKKKGLNLYLFLNRVSSERHLLRLIKALKGYKIAGYLLRKSDFELPSRHLGLFLPEHLKEAESLISKVATSFEETLDFSFIEELPEVKFPSSFEKPSFLPEFPFKKIGIALDESFNFYYQHVVDELKRKVEIFFLSPLKDQKLPSERIDAIFLGGGYPELYASSLSGNKNFIKDLKDFIHSNGVLYAECGGLIYLSDALYWDAKFYPMAGILPFKIIKNGLKLGYRRVKVKERHPFFGDLKEFYAHEFHYTAFEEKEFKGKKIYRVFAQEKDTYEEGYKTQKVLGSYLHFLAKPDLSNIGR